MLDLYTLPNCQATGISVKFSLDTIFKNPVILISVCAGLAVILLAVFLIIFFCVRKKRKKAAANGFSYNSATVEIAPTTEMLTTDTIDNAAEETPEAEDGSDPAPEVSETALDSPQEPDVPEPAPALPKEPAAEEDDLPVIVLIGTGGYYDNKKITQKGIMIIGRNTQRCTLKYPATEKGISALHCRLQRKGETVLLTDLGSQFGTFVNGQKLEPNVPFELQNGDTFWLADRVNSFYTAL